MSKVPEEVSWIRESPFHVRLLIGHRARDEDSGGHFKPYSAFGISTEPAYAIKAKIILVIDMVGTNISLEYFQCTF